MINIKYISLRLVRHFMPESARHFLLKRGWIIHPGLETRAPQEALKRYLDVLRQREFSLEGKRIMVFGYGGNYAIGCVFLQAGANQVVLCEKEGFQVDPKNRMLLTDYSEYLEERDGKVTPRPERIVIHHGDIRQMVKNGEIQPVDLILSNSVFEHLDDVQGITHALAQMTLPGGANLHFIDIRDHFFNSPFEMLTFKNKNWRWLNPSSNLNRLRLPDYKQIFEHEFPIVSAEVLERDMASFERTRRRIYAEFLSGDPQVDSVTLLYIWASKGDRS